MYLTTLLIIVSITYVHLLYVHSSSDKMITPHLIVYLDGTKIVLGYIVRDESPMQATYQFVSKTEMMFLASMADDELKVQLIDLYANSGQLLFMSISPKSTHILTCKQAYEEVCLQHAVKTNFYWSF